MRSPTIRCTLLHMIQGLADRDGVLLRSEAVALGVTDNALRRMVLGGDIVRIRQGAYVLNNVWVAAEPRHRHYLLTRAVMRQYEDNVALSHTSAALLYGAPDWGLDLDRVHLTNVYSISERNRARVVHHRGSLRVGDMSRMHGHWITSPTRTALDAASIVSRDSGVCLLDDFLQRGLTTEMQLEQQFQTMKEWPDTLGLYRTLQLCAVGSESVGETLIRLLIRDARLAMPELQWEVLDPNGRLAGRVDMAWPEHRLLLEFDGRTKYLRYRRPGESIEEAVLREKAREDLLRELTGWSMIRIVWADLSRPVHTAARIARMLNLAAA